MYMTGKPQQRFLSNHSNSCVSKRGYKGRSSIYQDVIYKPGYHLNFKNLLSMFKRRNQVKYICL